MTTDNPEPSAPDYLGSLTDAERAAFGDIFLRAVEIVRSTRRASTSPIQRRLRIGWNQASRILAAMERMGICGPETGYQPREVFIS